ncbi:transglycosylase domain-containing protein [Lentibacillus saliphilus]|uniref:transglycosylase domain-containing protein n=1 Tax=Lentibacillus saliphilus TaxID=2737028 RepID=UPI001C307AAF|nr:PBP1A family penicillin-binding protein [Lentibacillus saliphilus]
MKNNKQKSKKKHKTNWTSKRILKWSAWTAALVILLGLIGYTVILYGGRWVVNDDALVLDATTFIETSDGEEIGRLYTENRVPITIDQVPKHVQEAFIAIEDRRFRQHSGVDLKAITRAVYKDIIAMDKVEGGSTITQQLAKNLFLSHDKTWLRKTKEAMAAIYLERTLSKDEILELYLNEIYFGKGVYGIEMAAQTFFSKEAANLTLTEGALLAGLAKAPNGYSPIHHPEKARTRRNVVLKAMTDAGYITTEEKLRAQGQTLALNVQEKEAKPWLNSYIDLVMKEAADQYHLSINELKRGGYRIVVALNSTAQKTAYDLFQQDEYFPGNTEGTEGAFVLMDQSTGTIAAALGGRDYKLGDLNRVTVNRQPGSTFKPLAVYAPALMDADTYTPYSMLVDEQEAIADYSVRNHDGHYEGSVSLYEALIESKNTSAVWLLNEIGLPYAKEYLNKLDISIPDDGLSVALGGLTHGVSPLDMVKGYRAFAHEGKMITPHAIVTIYDSDQNSIETVKHEEVEVFSAQVAWYMTEMLTTAVQEGTGDVGDYPKALAGKTGSTQHPRVKGNYKDAWFVGYTPDYVVATWMGYDRSDEAHYLTGGSPYPTRLTKAILRELDESEPLTPSFTKPDHVAALEKPIELPDIHDVNLSYDFGGVTLLQGKLTWSGGTDDRIEYHIYKEKDGDDERIGVVKGEQEFTIKRVPLFSPDVYYVIPYDPLTKQEGHKSEAVSVSWFDRFEDDGLNP